MIDLVFKIFEAGIVILLCWWCLNYCKLKGRELRLKERKRLDFIKRNCR